MLKKGSKGNLAEINPLRTRKDCIYLKGTNNIFKISLSKLSTFINFQRYFYLNRVNSSLLINKELMDFAKRIFSWPPITLIVF